MPIVKAGIILEEVGNTPTFSKQLTLNEDESVMLNYEVATATTAQDIPMSFTTGIVAVDVMMITSTQAITYFLNGSATAITLDANGVHVLYGTNITAMTVTNASGSTANIKIYLAGT